MKTFIPISHNSDFINMMKKEGIEIFLPVGNEIFVALKEKDDLVKDS